MKTNFLKLFLCIGMGAIMQSTIAQTPNRIEKFSPLPLISVNSQLYDNGTTVALGYPGITAGLFKLDVNGDGRYVGPLRIGAYTLPNTDGTSGQVLKTNGAGILTWMNDNNTTYTAGTGINISGSNVITNTAPDQIITITGGGSTTVTGAYPNFTVSSVTGGIIGAHNGASASTLDNTRVALGQNFGESGNPGRLLSTREIPMNNNNIIFSNPVSQTVGLNRIGIGVNNPFAKVDVSTSTDFGAGMFNVSTISNVTNVGVSGSANGSTTSNAGGSFAAQASGGSDNTGVSAVGTSGTNTNFGGLLFAQGIASTPNNYGVRANAAIGITNYGGFFTANQPGSTNNYGIYAIGFGASSTNFAGFFQGNVTVTGIFSNPSDAKLKENVASLNSSLSLIDKLQPKTYTYKPQEAARLNLPEGKQYGLLAQELEEVFPEMVTKNTVPAQYDKNNNKIAEAIEFKGINYIGLIPVLIEGIKEQQQLIDAQQTSLSRIQNENAEIKNQLEQLKEQVEKLVVVTSTGFGSVSGSDLPLLEANSPNPFNESTTIKYHLPTTAGVCLIKVRNLAGAEVLQRILAEKGNGQLVISGGTLPAGTYIYELIINGKTVDSKKMILVK